MIAQRPRQRTIVVCLMSLAFACAALGPARAQEVARATLSVVGEGQVSAVPDMATFSTGVVASAKTAEEALAANSKSMSDLIAAVRDAGIEQKDIATSGFSIQPQYSQPTQNNREPPRVVGYEVRNTVTVKVRDLTRLGTLLDRMVQAGANQAGGLHFGVAEPRVLEEKARIAALQDGIAQAKTLAEAAGVRLLRLRRIAPGERGGVAFPAPPMMMMKADARAVPVEAGEISAQSQVTLVYDIEPL